MAEARTFVAEMYWDEDAVTWVTYVPALGISTYGDTEEEAMTATTEAVIGYLEAAEAEGIDLDPGRTRHVVEVQVPA